MAIGTVSFFNARKGFGFITPDQGGKDVYVDFAALENAGLTELREGQRLAFDIERSGIGPDMAVRLQRTGEP